MLHINDYPADPPREKMTDAHRVYPGDGMAPLPAILRYLFAAGFRGACRWNSSTASIGSRSRGGRQIGMEKTHQPSARRSLLRGANHPVATNRRVARASPAGSRTVDRQR